MSVSFLFNPTDAVSIGQRTFASAGGRVAPWGHDVVHVRDVGFSQSDDEAVFDQAAETDRVLISLDTDFGTILATRSASRPSVLLFRCRQKSTDGLLTLLRENLPEIERDLDKGALVVIEDTRIRIRRLPIFE